MSETKQALPDMVPIGGLRLEYFHDVQSNGHGLEIIFESVRDADTKKTVCRLTGYVDTNVAKLFAAAPDMLAALEAIVKDLSDEEGDAYDSLYEDTVEMAKSAIAKAKGGSK